MFEINIGEITYTQCTDYDTEFFMIIKYSDKLINIMVSSAFSNREIQV